MNLNLIIQPEQHTCACILCLYRVSWFDKMWSEPAIRAPSLPPKQNPTQLPTPVASPTFLYNSDSLEENSNQLCIVGLLN